MSRVPIPAVPLLDTFSVNTPVPSVNYCGGLDRCILYCILFVLNFMLALLCFCVATEFSSNKDLYNDLGLGKLFTRMCLCHV